MRRASLMALGFIAALSGCGSDTTGAGLRPLRGVDVELRPRVITVLPGGSTALRATINPRFALASYAIEWQQGGEAGPLTTTERLTAPGNSFLRQFRFDRPGVYRIRFVAADGAERVLGTAVTEVRVAWMKGQPRD